MQIRVLGPVEANADGRSLPLGGAKQRAVLAMLGLEANRTVSADHLIEGLWGDEAPVSAAKMVQNYVWRLRTVLGEGAGAEILTRGRGYELRIEPESVDAGRFQQLLGEASRAAHGGANADAAREALALWRGPALSDIADEPFAAPLIRRLEEQRLEAAELAIEADLAAGRHLEVTSEIDALVAEHPLRERLHAQRMLALYRCGRQAEALEAYREARRTLVEEIGVEPGPELRRLHDAILRQDASLEVDTAVPELPRELGTVSSSPLAGRERELAWLRAHWQRARLGDGGLVTLLGTAGMGKTRLVAELAGEAHGEGATVLYAAGSGAPEAALAAIARARQARRPTLLVLDDADRTPGDVRAALLRLTAELRSHASLAVVTGGELANLRPTASVTLPPLGADAVHRIALLYAPGETATDVPVDSLLEASSGVPRRVHELAAEWAQREAARRVDAVADRAAAGRTQARALQAELAGSVAALQSAHQRAESLAAADDDRPVVCPFKGLATFDVEDAPYFFGREQLVAELIARFVGAQLLAIVGPSGSGKSSALRAGLLPALAAGVLPASDGWRQVLIRPGERSLRELRRAMSAVEHDRRVVLAIDQFEEIFTACRDERERDAFVAAVVQAAEDPGGQSVVVLAVRADFYSRCAAYPELARLLGANHVLVGPMSRDELRRAITQPAEQVGLRVEPELEDAVVADVEGQPGALPLLSTALLELWGRRRGRRLELADYNRTGGVHGAVARLAEDALGRLQPEEQHVARKLLLRLADEGENGETVRRRVPLAELEAHRSESVARVLDVLTDRRLLTVSAGAVEVAHEALLREWPRLRGWLEQDAEGRRLHRHLTLAARDWTEGGRDRSELYRGARLASALEWRTEHDPELNLAERQFLDASRAAGERARRRAHFALAGVVALLVIATIAAVFALDGRGRARAEARAAEAQRLGAQALNEQTLDRSLLLARQGVALDDTPTTRDNLLAALRRSPAAIGVMRGDGDGLNAVALHPDGRTVAVGDYRGTVVFLDARTQRRLGKPHESGPVSEISALSFSADGTRLASAGSTAYGGFVDLFDGQTRRHIARLDAGDPLYEGIESVSFSPDSRVVAAHAGSLHGDAYRSSRLLRWDARTGRRLGDMRVIPGRASVLLGSISPRSRLVTSSVRDHATVIRDAGTMRAVREFPVAGPVAALSPARRVIAFGSRDGSVRLLDLRTGEHVTADGRHEGPVTAIRFSPDGRRLVTAGRDERLIVWDTIQRAAVEALEARGRGLVANLAISPDGNTAYSVGRDGTALAWDLDGARRLERPLRATGRSLAPRSLTVAANGSSLAMINAHGSVDLFDGRTLRSSGRIRIGGRRPGAAALAPDGRTLAATTADGWLGFWDVRTRRPLTALEPAHADGASALSFSADGRWLASGAGDNFVRLWDARRGTSVESLVRNLADLSLSNDGMVLAATLFEENFNGGLELYSVPDLKLIKTVRAPVGTVGRFSDDGRSLIYGDRAGRVWTFDTRTWRPRGRPLLAHVPLLTADLSPDGRLLATTSIDGTAQLWDVTSGRPIGGPLTAGSGDVVGTGFTRGARELAVMHERGGYVWDVRPSAWERHACAVAGRTLSRAEWEDALPQREYAPAC